MKDETTKAIIRDGIDTLADMVQNDETIDRDDLHNRMYNEDYFVIGHYEARQHCEKFEGGTFGAIEKVREYEVEQFGEFTTPVEDERIANMLAYIVGEEALGECKTYTEAEGDLDKKQLEAIKAELEAKL